jgi:hypothetical protein
MCGICNRAGTKVPNAFTNDIQESNELTHSRENKRTGHEQTKNLKTWFVYSALRNSIKVASQGNNAIVASSNNTVGAHSHRL